MINDSGTFFGGGVESCSANPGVEIPGVGGVASTGEPYLSTIGCTGEISGEKGLLNLLNLIDGGIGSPFGLNDAGQIFTLDGKFKYTLLTPVPELLTGVPEPSTLILLSSAAIVLTLRRARKKHEITRQ